MKFRILHEIKGRLRIHISCSRMSCRDADILQYSLLCQTSIIRVKVYERSRDAVICYTGEREDVIKLLQKFSGEKVSAPEHVWQNSERRVNRYYQDKLIWKVMLRMAGKLFLPMPVRCTVVCCRSARFIWKGIHTLCQGQMGVSVLDGTAITVSLLRRDIKTAGSVMFLLGIGELLEEWTHKKSVDDLARSMSLDTGRVWKLTEGREALVDAGQVREEDQVVLRMGNVIPFDGVVMEGNGAVNQSSMTGEALPVAREKGGYVYAGTVLEEGQLTICVKETSGSNKYEKIVRMIEESEKLKSKAEGRADRLADRLVPYTLLGTALVYLLTRNATKALSVLMVDFSCALKPDELLRIAACLEEHFPHSMARAVVHAASEKGLIHEETHSRVEYIVAHGISSMIDGKKVVIGSYHFVFEDEGCSIPEGLKERFEGLQEGYSHLYLAIEKQLAAVICIEDPLREEAAPVVSALRKAGFDKIVMMTGDSERIAGSIASKVGVDEYYSEVLPEEKADFVKRERAAGRKVIMVGDGINDSPALSAADVGIAISDGAQIAREIADITIEADNLSGLLTLRAIGCGLLERIRKNYIRIVGINSGLILLGITGTIQPTTSAMAHNVSTLMIGLNSMRNLLDEK
ncbi:MAG: HAD-IC family P-type ATPase [Lachnospiraceae bacterium]|jgi:cation transport ATPase|nr:HAD-IC family P-type ATPase [Lachnospiraceae bacterium]